MNKVNLFIKRLFDIVSASALSIVLAPLWIVVSIWVKLDSKGPVLFRQERRTKDGKVFEMLKFRSMVVDAENMDTGLFSFENDPRITKSGKVLRDTSIDELPQLFNIIKGDMSVVGPRPCVKYELGDYETLNKRYKKRFQMKAGLTGLAQIKGRNDIKWDEKVTFDNEYIDKFEKYGILLDVKILLLSLLKVFRKENITENKPDEEMTDAEAAKYEADEIVRIAHMPDE